MIREFTRFSLKSRPLVLALTVGFIFFGVFSFQRLPIEAYPDVTNVSFQIITLFPGHAAEEVEKLVTIPIENEMNGIPERTSIRSISQFGLSVVTLVFEDDADNAFVRSQAAEHLTNVTLPSDAQPSLSPDSTPVGEIYRYTLQAPKDYPLTELKALEDFVVERQFRTVPGVADVNGFGGPTKEYQVWVDPAKLKSYGLTLTQVFTALSNCNQNAGGSYIEHGQEMYIVRGLGLIHNAEDIGNVAVDSRNGTPIRIKDIGVVTIGERLRLGRVGITVPGKLDNDDAVEGIVILRKGENALDVLKRVNQKVEEINRDYLPPGVRLVPYYDRTALIHRALHNVEHNMIDGVLLVLFVLILFLGLGNFRSAIVVATVVPLSLLGAFTMLDLQHIPANLISMGAIDFGIIVDSAVVVVENMLRLLEENPLRRKYLSGTIIDAVSQMSKPILFSKAILITAFIPLFTLQRVEGKIFRPMALTLTFGLIAGTLLAFTLIPVLSSYALRRKKLAKESWVVHTLLRFYRRLLDGVLRIKYLFLAGSILVVVAVGFLATHLGTEFLPKLDEGSLWVRCYMPKTIAPSEAVRLVHEIRAKLAAFPEVTTVVSQLGQPDDGTDINGFDVVENDVELKPRNEWTSAHDREGLCQLMKEKLAAIPGVETEFSQNIEDNVNEAISGIKGELGIKIYGNDPAILQAASDKIADILNQIPGAEDVSAQTLLGQPQVQIEINRLAISRYGLAINDVQSIIVAALGGSTATRILDGERAFDLVVKLNPKSVADLDAIGRIPLYGSNNELLTLADVATISVKNGSTRILRENNERRTDISFTVRGRDLGSVVAEAQRKVKKEVTLPAGYRMVWTGSFENQQRAVARLAVVVPITLVIIYFLLVTAFNSNRLGILVLLNMPFVTCGGVLALFAAHLNLSVSAMIGFMALFGISLQNGVIMVERIKELLSEGKPMDVAVKQGSLSRVRPVVMTAMMAMLGLLPAALSTAVGAETSRPFAVVIIGGLIAEVSMRPFLIPILYPWFHPNRKKVEEDEIDPEEEKEKPVAI